MSPVVRTPVRLPRPGSGAAGRGGSVDAPRHPAAGAPERGLLRVIRSIALGGSSLVLGAAAHLAAGGSLPPLALLMPLLVPLGLVAAAMTARRCRAVPVLAALLSQQLLLHWLFGVAANGSACSTGSHAMSAHILASDAPASCATTATAMSLPMIAAHLVATVLVALLLLRGEAALWRVVDSTVAAAFCAPGVRTSVRRRAAITEHVVRVVTPSAFSPARLRGPPASAVLL